MGQSNFKNLFCRIADIRMVFWNLIFIRISQKSYNPLRTVGHILGQKNRDSGSSSAQRCGFLRMVPLDAVKSQHSHQLCVNIASREMTKNVCCLVALFLSSPPPLPTTVTTTTTIVIVITTTIIITITTTITIVIIITIIIIIVIIITITIIIMNQSDYKEESTRLSNSVFPKFL
ncbi:hypothetical protein Cadr_000017310 [Camelus dromedarius]|uniref:Uncharacterized protein n=1 Tax=Camelus dromedarius TaxID=9838 RepID=A0A5N4DES4_CAMDR|nr:hypothetical protein Cadr_000017310 [Camelus dromedarius]